MLREVALSGALAPSLLFYFLAAIVLSVIVDRVVARFGLYRFVWHQPLAQLGLFLCVFTALVFATRP
jgi:protein AaeX